MAYKNKVASVTDDIDYCYDCTAAVTILELYYSKYSEYWNENITSKNCGGDNFYDDISEEVNLRLTESSRENISPKCNWDVNGNTNCVNLASDRDIRVAAMVTEINDFLTNVAIKNQNSIKGNDRVKKRRKLDFNATISCFGESTREILLRQLRNTEKIKKVDEIDMNKIPEESSTLSWMTVTEPELLDIPPSSLLDTSMFGLGHCVPSNSALDIWLWQILLEILVYIQLQRGMMGRHGSDDEKDRCSIAVRPAQISAQSFNHDLQLSHVIVNPKHKREILELALEWISVRTNDVSEKKSCDDEKLIGQKVPVIILITQAKFGYMFFADKDAICAEEVVRLSIPIQNVKNDLGVFVCGGDVVITDQMQKTIYSCVKGKEIAVMDVSVNLEISSAHEFRIDNGCISWQECHAHDFVCEHLDINSDVWRQDILTMSGITSIKAVHTSI